MKFDLHTHHERCGHAVGTIRDYVEAGIRHGLQVIGISDHSPYFASAVDREQPGIAMAKSEFARYIEEVQKLKAEYAGRIDVLLGVESDFFPEHAEVYRKVYDQYPFDYIIGSVHLSGGASIFNKKRWNGLSERQKVEQKDLYYHLIEQSARSGMFQILGHIDAMRGFYPAFSDIQSDAVDKTLKTIGEYDIAIEINTSGKTKDCGGWYPIDAILERALHFGVKVTFGSDAHKPERVGDDWEDVAARLQDIGFRDWVYFKEKQMVKVAL
ncbi:MULTISPECIES: histidinol-phosphatase [Paenibacillus]|uniref:histidinol-phosphatase n=1 Tax=Paenibacillus TaxID=44249 RepID=UPI0022B8DE09|nr:histidinol-phosphatase [Paenibacillus caseinilyticus]MCZ8519252.1 histidinol-phosphatase [Paenibacillus caseinilyticus]